MVGPAHHDLHGSSLASLVAGQVDAARFTVGIAQEVLAHVAPAPSPGTERERRTRALGRLYRATEGLERFLRDDVDADRAFPGHVFADVEALERFAGLTESRLADVRATAARLLERHERWRAEIPASFRTPEFEASMDAITRDLRYLIGA